MRKDYITIALSILFVLIEIKLGILIARLIIGV